MVPAAAVECRRSCAQQCAGTSSGVNDSGDPVPGVTHPGRGDGPSRFRRRWLGYALMQIVLVGLAALVVADIWLPVFGVDTRTESTTTTDGVELQVEYPAVTRPALATSFAIEVHDPDGFDGPIEIAISRPWIEAWDENAYVPAPLAASGDPNWVVQKFTPPDGDTFRVFYDARLEPAWQSNVSGTVQLRRDGRAVAEVDFETKVRP